MAINEKRLREALVQYENKPSWFHSGAEFDIANGDSAFILAIELPPSTENGPFIACIPLDLGEDEAQVQNALLSLDDVNKTGMFESLLEQHFRAGVAYGLQLAAKGEGGSAVFTDDRNLLSKIWEFLSQRYGSKNS